MSFNVPATVSAYTRRGTPVASPSLETPRTDRGSSTHARTPAEAELPEPHWQATIESATD